MRAVILAGGKGTRLRPYTTLIPKPLVPLGGKCAIVELVILQLKTHGFTHITLAVNHLAQLVMAYFGDGSKYGVRIDYSIERDELSTIGPITLIEDLPENFLVINGDVLSNLDYGLFLKTHILDGNLISVASCQREAKIDFGVLNFDKHNRLTGFEEKPSLRHNVSMGAYCLSREVIYRLTRGERFGFDDLMLKSLSKEWPVSIFRFEGFWLDIGRPDDYAYADDNFDTILQELDLDLQRS